jgi:hypothetical protein
MDMPRPKKPGKLLKTSISISEELWQFLIVRKKKQNTMDEFLKHIVFDYYTIKEEFDFVEDAYNKASKKNEEYARRISKLENTIVTLSNQVEPARGVAAMPYFPSSSVPALPLLVNDMVTNLPQKNIEEVTEKV